MIRPAHGKPFVRAAFLATVLVAGCASDPAARNKADAGESTLATEVKKDPADYDNIWDRIRAGFAFPPIRNRHVTYYEKWYAERPRYVHNMWERARRYLHYIVERVEARGIPTEIALLPAIESAYKPHAYSRAHAAGLWQFIPSTGRIYGLKQNWWYDGRRDVIAATDSALDYLEKLHKQFNGDWHLALAAYNAGERRVERSIKHNHRRGQSTKYEALRLKRETRHYVPKLQAVKNIVANPDKYGLELPPIPNRPYFQVVKTGDQIDLGVAAELAGMHVRDMHLLNAGFRRWATDPRGPHYLVVPRIKAQRLADGLRGLPGSKRMKWDRYAVRRGDTLGGIAHRYGISVAAIRSTNKIRGSLIRAGQDLLIPLSSRRINTSRIARAASGASRGNAHIVHRVRRGDTLYAIARRYNVYVHQIAEWNNLNVNGVLRAGQPIKIFR